MKRLHVNVSVIDLDASVRFYAALFDAQPTVHKEDYAKWMLDDPRVNFAITTHGSHAGIDHLGIQVETGEALNEVRDRLETAGAPMVEQGETTCCYARSEKNWIFDPQGIRWETFLTKGDSPDYGTDLDLTEAESACCAPLEQSRAQLEDPRRNAAGPVESSGGSGCCA